ncbi:MAG: DNA repair protein RadA [Lachnospiraceae bacterium]|jgi:DNA repair protein RadA/Sms
MAKTWKNVFFCQNCGYESSKWMGQCPGCREWNTFVEEVSVSRGKNSSGRKSGNVPVKLSEVSANEADRINTGINELDRVLGGGIVKGSLVLIGGDPGIGKSTLLLQMCHHLADSGKKVLYVSGEESLRQIRMRAERVGCGGENLLLYCENDLESVQEQVEKCSPEVVIVDSIQTMMSDNVASAPGSVSQVREACGVLLKIAKSLGIAIFIVGHVTKEGSVAGPRVLEHMVDTVLYFEGDNNSLYRILRAAKNRFGSTNEIGVFEMQSAGLSEVANPSEYMLSGKPEGASGSVVTCSAEGTRMILLEIQALVCKTNFGYPRRTAAGIDNNRLNLLLAVIEKRLCGEISSYDAYVNIAGGIRINEPSADLAIVLAAISSLRDIPLGDKTVAFGEVGLSGEIRGVSQADSRVREAAKLGFEKVVMPACNYGKIKDIEGIEIIPVNSVYEAVKKLGL